ncbi:helix-turn-helix domain-containing protein [Rhizosphaericola mali]|uniref:Helix-turn-helix transcriptional regulator n=1 Tax=Rhizosphaericola mali TaxID=2545455 RepID=A0A5P2GFB1_9BACT|nr:AraC family transcriptional regulator [Rhizosphaericola mali]QES90301.1 helix-turn-helix transcriptional regulator [Rhizosphaericola mali]
MRIKSTIKEADEVIIDVETISLNDFNNKLIINEYDINISGYLTAHIRTKSTKYFSVITTEMNLYDSVTDIFEIGGDIVFLGFLSEGHSNMYNKMDGQYDKISVGSLYRNFLKSPKMQIKMHANRKVKYCSIFIDRQFYIQLIENEEWTYKDSFSQFVRKNITAPQVEQSVAVDDELFNLIKSISQLNISPKYAIEYLKIKFKELAIVFSDKYTTAIQQHIKISADDQRKLLQSRAYLTINFMEPPTIKSLSKIVSLNELKLKQGFKMLFDTTIHAYIIQLRMQKAEIFLQEKKMQIADIAFELGYKSVSHFIVMFKSYYHVTPKQYLDKK